MTSHTPAPWKAGSTSVTAPETEDRLGMHLRIFGGNGKDNAANARLIAAAPDMLATLIDLRDRLDDFKSAFESTDITVADVFDSFYRELIDEAIKKATGAA